MSEATPLIILIKTLQQAVGAELDASLRGSGLTLPQLSALVSIQRIPGASSAELARAAFVTPQTMNEQIAALLRGKLIERKPDPANARVLRMTLTGRGIEAVAKSGKRAAVVEQKLVGLLDAKEQRIVRAALQRWIEALGERVPTREVRAPSKVRRSGP